MLAAVLFAMGCSQSEPMKPETGPLPRVPIEAIAAPGSSFTRLATEDQAVAPAQAGLELRPVLGMPLMKPAVLTLPESGEVPFARVAPALDDLQPDSIGLRFWQHPEGLHATVESRELHPAYLPTEAIRGGAIPESLSLAAEGNPMLCLVRAVKVRPGPRAISLAPLAVAPVHEVPATSHSLWPLLEPDSSRAYARQFATAEVA